MVLREGGFRDDEFERIWKEAVLIYLILDPPYFWSANFGKVS
jgi:hypothetical protein